MRKYSYTGYAMRMKSNMMLKRIILTVLILTFFIIGLITENKYLIYTVMIYPFVWIYTRENLVPCKIEVIEKSDEIAILYRDVQRKYDLAPHDEMVLFEKKDIKNVYWNRQKQILGLHGYPIIADHISKKRENDSILKPKRKHIYISYPYASMLIDTRKINVRKR